MARWWLVVALASLLAIPTAIAPTGSVADVTYLTAFAAIVAAIWWGRAQLVPTERRAWTLFALAATSWLAGDTIQRMMGWFGRFPQGPSWPDCFWLGSYPLLIAAVLHVIHRRGLPRKLQRDIALDVIVVTSAAFVAAWHVLVAPALIDGGAPMQVLTGMAYPIGDVAVFALAVTLAMLPDGRSAPAALIIVCLGLTLPIDLLQTVLPQVLGDRLDSVLLVVNSLLGAAALHPDRGRLAQHHPLPPRHRMHRWRIVLLGFSLLTVSLIAALPGGHQLVRVVPAVVASVVISCTVVLRFYRAVEEREAAEAAVTFQAHHDQLTGAANRVLLMDRLVAAVHSDGPSDPVSGSAVLIFIDLDGFKRVNDTWGHLAGDAVLRAVADRLRALVRGGDTVARVGGDEFVVLCRRVPTGGAEPLADRMRAALRQPVDAGPAEVSVDASIGLVTLSGAGDPTGDAFGVADELLRRADSAMYEAKRTGGGVRRAGDLAASA